MSLFPTNLIVFRLQPNIQHASNLTKVKQITFFTDGEIINGLLYPKFLNISQSGLGYSISPLNTL